jgi:hypothetical protein
MLAAVLLTLRHSWPSVGDDAALPDDAALSAVAEPSRLAVTADVEALAEALAEDDADEAEPEDDGEFDADVDGVCEGESALAGVVLEELLDGDGEGEALGEGLADGVLRSSHTPPAADAREVKASACAIPGTPTENRTLPPTRPAATVRTRTKHM